MKNLLRVKASKLLTVFAAIAFSNGTFAASSQTLLDENFQDVTGVGTTQRTVTNINNINPTQLDGSPLPTFSNNAGTGTGTGGDASNASFNVRKGNNIINGLGNNGFDSFFGTIDNQFLVIGDNTGDLGGSANGGTRLGASSTMNLTFTLDSISLINPKFLDISFDYAFDANNTNNLDDFIATLVLSDLSTINLINHTAPNSTTRGNFNWSIDYTTLAFPPSNLNFKLIEGRNTGSSAVGLDNIKVTARIPEPGVLSLLGISLLGLGMSRRQKA